MYFELAKENGLTLTELALSFVSERSFVVSNIIGATSLTQLKENIGSYKIKLSEEILSEIDNIHSKIPNPAV